MNTDFKFNDLVGKTLTKVTQEGTEAIHMTDTEGVEYVMHQHPDCCANVDLEDVAGELQDLVGSPIVRAEENTSSDGADGLEPKDEKGYKSESYTWTFYRIATAKGLVVIRWYGSSNGYYSERAEFHIVGDPEAWC